MILFKILKKFNDKLILNLATITGIVAALLLALNINQFILAYSLFLTSSIFWVVFSIKDKNHQLLTMNVVFACINIIGLIRFS
jgi:ribonuclease PH